MKGFEQRQLVTKDFAVYVGVRRALDELLKLVRRRPLLGLMNEAPRTGK